MSGEQRSEAELAAITVGERVRHDAPVELVPYDPAWPDRYADLSASIRSVLGDRILRIEHVGSTSVPGLSAKPILDVLLVVADPADEAAYVPALEGAGYALRIREPDWWQHRMLRRDAPAVHLHVFGPAAQPEIDRMVRFRDRLRAVTSDRDEYERAKRELATRTWRYVQDYADAKSAVVEAILARAAADG